MTVGVWQVMAKTLKNFGTETLRFAMLSLAMCAMGVVCEAGSYTNSATGNWDASGSWTGDKPVAGGALDAVIVFKPSGTDNSTNNLAGDFALNRMVFASGTVTLTGNALVFTNNGATGPLVTNSSGNAAVIRNNITLGSDTTFCPVSSITNSGVVSGLRGVTMKGAGALVLSGANTYFGSTAVGTAGVTNTVLYVNSNSALGSWMSGTTVNGGGSANVENRVVLGNDVTVTSETLTLAASSYRAGLHYALDSGVGTWDGNIVLSGNACYLTCDSAGGSLVIGGSSADTVTGSPSSLYFRGSGTNILNSRISIGTAAVYRDDAGTLILNSASNAWGINTSINQGMLTLGVSDALPVTTTLSIGKSTQPASAVIDLNGNSQRVAGLADLHFSGGTQRIISAAPATLTVSNTTANTFGAAGSSIEGAVSLVKTGSGTLTLTGTNTFSGGTTVATGTLLMGANAALASTNWSVAKGATLKFDHSLTLSGKSVTIGADNWMSGGLLDVTGDLTLGGKITIVGSDVNYGRVARCTGALSGTFDEESLPPHHRLDVRGTELWVTFIPGTCIKIQTDVNTNDWPVPFLSRSLPIADGFENYPVGFPLSGMPGWLSAKDDESKVISQLYDYTGSLPLDTTHTNFLNLKTEGQTLRTLPGTNSAAGTAHVWVDMMACVNASESSPSFSDGGAMIAFFADYNGDLVLYAASLDASGQRNAGYYNLTPGRSIAEEWHRFTFDIMSNADGSNDFVRVFLDGTVMTNAAARVSPANLETNGTWFCLTGHAITPAPFVGFQGEGQIDDLVITPDQIFETVLYELTIGGGSGSGAYTNGQQVVIAASSPPIGTEFDRWTGATQYVASVTSATTTVSMPALDSTLAATYKPSTYTVSFNAQGGVAPVPASKTVTYGSSYGTLAATTRTGYSFAGWHTNSACAMAEVTNATMVTIAHNHTLYAKWILLTTTTAPVQVPYLWLDQFSEIMRIAGGNYEIAAFIDPDLDGMVTWQEYVAGSNPTNGESFFRSLIAVSNDWPWVTWTPDLGTARVYTVLGRTNLTESTWGPTNMGTRFFRVKVDMP